MKPLTLVAAVLTVVFAGSLIACEKPSADEPVAERAHKPPQAGDDKGSKKVVDALQDEGVSDSRRLEAIHQARNANIAQAIPALKALLGSDDPAIVVASAAALEGLEARDVGGDVVEAASLLSRAHAFEHLRQLLFIIAEVGGPQARIYLETLAEGHQVPGIRQTAAKVLEDMKP